MKLYRLYGLKALAEHVKSITDASTREGRAVTLICSVLALGALSLVELPTNVPAGGPLVLGANFGEALGFYVVALRLLHYTHDTIETMIAYLLMVRIPRYLRAFVNWQGVFAIQTTDSKGVWF